MRYEPAYLSIQQNTEKDLSKRLTLEISRGKHNNILYPTDPLEKSRILRVDFDSSHKEKHERKKFLDI